MFQSTPSGGKATPTTLTFQHQPVVSIHAFRGEGDGVDEHIAIRREVSIHAFRGEGDIASVPKMVLSAKFQSTPSGGKATRCPPPQSSDAGVSIHAFRGEGDGAISAIVCTVSWFQSTPSGGKATARLGQHRADRVCFNPRLPGGRRPRLGQHRADRVCFNPRLPGGRRRCAQQQHRQRCEFQSTPSGGKATGAIVYLPPM